MMKKPIPALPVLCCLTLCLFCGCRTARTERNMSGEYPPVRSRMVVSTQWVEDQLRDSDTVILHVTRNPESYEQGHLPGARLLGWKSIATERDGIPNELPPASELVQTVRELGINEDSRVVLYDDEAGLRAARAYVALDYLGLGDQAALMDGQLARWRAEERPITAEDASPPAESDFVPRLNPAILVSLQEVKDAAWLSEHGADTVLVDARPEDQYTGVTPGDGIERPGHIPGAVNVFWERNIESVENPVLRPVRELRALYSFVDPDDLCITYCRTCGQASHAYFTLKYLGYDTRVYDGSFYEWSGAEETAVKTGTAK